MKARVTRAFNAFKVDDILEGREAIRAVEAGYAVPVTEKPVKETRSK